MSLADIIWAKQQELNKKAAEEKKGAKGTTEKTKGATEKPKFGPRAETSKGKESNKKVDVGSLMDSVNGGVGSKAVHQYINDRQAEEAKKAEEVKPAEPKTDPRTVKPGTEVSDSKAQAEPRKRNMWNTSSQEIINDIRGATAGLKHGEAIHSTLHQQMYAAAHNGAVSGAAIAADENAARAARRAEADEFFRRTGMTRAEYDRQQRRAEAMRGDIQRARDAKMNNDPTYRFEQLGRNGNNGNNGNNAPVFDKNSQEYKDTIAKLNEWGNNSQKNDGSRYGGRYTGKDLPRGIFKADGKGGYVLDESRITNQAQLNEIVKAMDKDNDTQNRWKNAQVKRERAQLDKMRQALIAGNPAAKDPYGDARKQINGLSDDQVKAAYSAQMKMGEQKMKGRLTEIGKEKAALAEKLGGSFEDISKQVAERGIDSLSKEQAKAYLATEGLNREANELKQGITKNTYARNPNFVYKAGPGQALNQDSNLTKEEGQAAVAAGTQVISTEDLGTKGSVANQVAKDALSHENIKEGVQKMAEARQKAMGSAPVTEGGMNKESGENAIAAAGEAKQNNENADTETEVLFEEDEGYKDTVNKEEEKLEELGRKGVKDTLNEISADRNAQAAQDQIAQGRAENERLMGNSERPGITDVDADRNAQVVQDQIAKGREENQRLMGEGKQPPYEASEEVKGRLDEQMESTAQELLTEGPKEDYEHTDEY